VLTSRVLGRRRSRGPGTDDSGGATGIDEHPYRAIVTAPDLDAAITTYEGTKIPRGTRTAADADKRATNADRVTAHR